MTARDAREEKTREDEHITYSLRIEPAQYVPMNTRFTPTLGTSNWRDHLLQLHL